MSNISFANPYLLLVLIPLLLVIVVPFVITFKKDNIGIRNIMSLILHFIICVLVVLVLAGMNYKTAIDQTDIYVLADVSYSANRNIDTIDSYIKELDKNKDSKTSIGIVCFGIDTPYVLTIPGENIKSIRSCVEQERVNRSGTDISGALRYTSSLFDDSCIKRIILMTDGYETSSGNVLNVVNELRNQNVYVDAIYLDDNLPEDEIEAQITGVEYTMSTYKDKTESVQVTIQSNLAHSTSLLNIYKNNVLMENSYQAPVISKGLNVITLPLDTTEAGVFDYRIELNVNGDTSSYNNTYSFTQTVTNDIKILYLANDDDEKDFALKYFKKDNTEVTYLNIKQNKVPYTLEDLCQYDEYVLSDVNIKNINSSATFATNLDLMISRYSKSLITLGNTYLDGSSDDVSLKTLANMLPIRYGDSQRDGKLVCIILDISKSMVESFHLQTAKTAANKIVDLASESDNIMVLTLSGETMVLQVSTKVTDGVRVSIKNAINEIEERQGTLIGSSIKQFADNFSNLPFYQKQIYLLSDGATMNGDVDAVDVAYNLYKTSGTTISCIGIGDRDSLLKDIATASKGNYYTAEDVEELEILVDNELSSEISETVYDDGDDRAVTIKRSSAAILNGIEGNIPVVRGYYLGTTKNSATTVLSTIYEGTTRDYEVPLYAFWRYGNGSVSSLACDVNSGYWLSTWTGEGGDLRYEANNNGEKILYNLAMSNLPTQRVEAPLIIDISLDGINSYVSINPPTLNPNASLSLSITYPNGKTVEKEMVYTTTNYEISFESQMTGKYYIKINYELNNINYAIDYYYNVSYAEEYNSFNYYEIYNLNHMVNTGNPVYEDASNIDLSVDETRSTTYSFDFTILFMTIAISLFIVDIFIRKVKWADIRQIFKKEGQ